MSTPIHDSQLTSEETLSLDAKQGGTVRSLYDLLKKKARTMTRLERLSIGIAIIKEGVIIAENSSSLIPKGRLLAYKNYDSLSKLAWVPMLGKTLGKPCQETSSADPLCLHWDSTRAPTITEVLEVENKNNGVVTTVFGFSEKFKHLVNPTHPDDKDFDSVVQLVQQGYKVTKSDWEQGFWMFFLQQKTLVDKAGQKTKMSKHKMKKNNKKRNIKINEGQTLEEEEEQMEADTEDEEPVQVERQKRGRVNKEQEHKKNEEKRKDEAYEKAKEKFQDKMVPNSIIIENVLGVVSK
ncbi:BnaAnng19800D [Brassica napus]|uniref:BnaAnng19800D protein n=1 Tax=Brassica napus TaxID=3708 RepID=A0A078JES0_BRANA|nr:BnaAnng19800D [Brassica napus]